MRRDILLSPMGLRWSVGWGLILFVRCGVFQELPYRQATALLARVVARLTEVPTDRRRRGRRTVAVAVNAHDQDYVNVKGVGGDRWSQSVSALRSLKRLPGAAGTRGPGRI